MLTGLTEVNNILFSSIDYRGFKKANSACYTMVKDIIINILPKCKEILAEHREISASTPKAKKAGPPTVTKPSSFKRGGKRSKKRKTRKSKTRKFKKY